MSACSRAGPSGTAGVRVLGQGLLPEWASAGDFGDDVFMNQEPQVAEMRHPTGHGIGYRPRVRHDKDRHASRRSGDLEEPRKLYRSRNQRMIAGVCGGLADYFNVDATLVRVLFLLLAVFGGTGLVIYLVMWIIVPDISKV